MKKQLRHTLFLGCTFIFVFTEIISSISFANELEAHYTRIKEILLQIKTLNNTSSDLEHIQKQLTTLKTIYEKPLEIFILQKTSSIAEQSNSNPPPPPALPFGSPPPAPQLPPVPPVPSAPPFSNPPPAPQFSSGFNAFSNKKTVPTNHVNRYRQEFDRKKLTENNYSELIDYYYETIFLKAIPYDFTILNATQNKNSIEKINLYTETMRTSYNIQFKNKNNAFENEAKKINNILLRLGNLFCRFIEKDLASPVKTLIRVEDLTSAMFKILDTRFATLTDKQKFKLQRIIEAINTADGTHNFDDFVNDVISNKTMFLECLKAEPKGRLAPIDHAVLLDILYDFFLKNVEDVKQQAKQYIASIITGDFENSEEKNKKAQQIQNLKDQAQAFINQFKLNIDLNFTSEYDTLIEQFKKQELAVIKYLSENSGGKFPFSQKIIEQLEAGNAQNYMITLKGYKITNPNSPLHSYRSLIDILEKLGKLTTTKKTLSLSQKLTSVSKKRNISITIDDSNIPKIENYYKNLYFDDFDDSAGFDDDDLKIMEAAILEQIQTTGELGLDFMKSLDEMMDTVREETKNEKMKNNKKKENTDQKTNNILDPKTNLRQKPTSPSSQNKPSSEKFSQQKLPPPTLDGNNSVQIEMLQKVKQKQEAENARLNKTIQDLKLQLEEKDKAIQQQNMLLENKEKQIQQLNNVSKRQSSLTQSKHQSKQENLEATITDLRKQLQKALTRRNSGFSFRLGSEYTPRILSPINNNTSEELKNKDAQIQNLEKHIQQLTSELNKAQTQIISVQNREAPIVKEQNTEVIEDFEENRMFLENLQDDLEEKEKNLLKLQQQIELRAKELDARENALKLKESSKTKEIIKEQKINNTQQKLTGAPTKV